MKNDTWLVFYDETYDEENPLNPKYNQVHLVPNVYVTDGACMTSSGCQNPSLTYMALTARAAATAVEMLRAGDI